MKPNAPPPSGNATHPPPMWSSAGYPPPFLMMQQPPRAMDPSSRPFKPSSTIPRLDPNAPAFVPKTAHVLPSQPTSPAVVNAAARTVSASGPAQVQVPTGPPPVSGTPNFVGSGKGFVPYSTATPTVAPASAAPAAAVSPPAPVPEVKPKAAPVPAPKLQTTMSWAKRCSAANEVPPEQPKLAVVAEVKKEEPRVEAPEPKPVKPQSGRKGNKRSEDPDAAHAKKGSRSNRRNREQAPKEDHARTQEPAAAKAEAVPAAKPEVAAPAKPEVVPAPPKVEVAPAPAKSEPVAAKAEPVAAKVESSPAAKPVKPITRTIGQWAQVARGAAAKQPEKPTRSLVASVTATVTEAVQTVVHAVQPATPSEESPTPIVHPEPLKRAAKHRHQDPSPRAADHPNHQHKPSRDTAQKATHKAEAKPKELPAKAAQPEAPASKAPEQPKKVAAEPEAPVEAPKPEEPKTAVLPVEAVPEKEEPVPVKEAPPTPVQQVVEPVAPAVIEEVVKVPEVVVEAPEVVKEEESKEAVKEAERENTTPASSVVVETQEEAPAPEKPKSSWGANTPAAVLSAKASPSEGKPLPTVSGLSRAAKFGGSTRMSTIVSSLKTQQGRLAGLDEKSPSAVAEKPAVVAAEMPPLEHQFEALSTESGTLVYAMSDMMKIRYEPMCTAAMESHRFPEGIVDGPVASGYADGSRAQFGTNPISAMLDMGRGMNKSSTTGGFNIPPALRKGMSTDFAASEALWSSGGAKPRHLANTQSNNGSFGRSQTYADRSSNERDEWQRSGQKAIPSGGASGAPLPEIPEDSWQVQQEKQKATGPRDVKVIRRLRAQLNKMTPKTYDDILKAILDIGIEDMDEAQEFVNLIFDKAITNHGYIEMYADLCKDLGEELTARNLFPGKDGDGKDFRRLLLASCQQAFEKHLDQDFVAPEGISDEDRLELLLIHKEKMKGNLMFVACLGTRGLVVRRVLTMVMNNLLESSKSLQLEALASFLPLVIESLSEGKQATQFDQIFEKVEELSQDDKVEHRIQCLLKDTLDIRNAYLKTTQQNQMLERRTSSRKGAWKAVMAESNRR